MKLFTKFFLSVLILLLQFSSSNCQKLVDIKNRSEEDGLKDRLVKKITRDKYGYFYLSSQSNIQQYDGEHFEDVDISTLINSKLNPDDIIELTSIKGDVFIKLNTSNKIFFIRAGSNKVEEIILNKSYQTFYSNDQIFLVSKNKNNYTLSSYKPEKKKLQLISNIDYEPNNIIFQNNKIFYSSNDVIYKLENQKSTKVTSWIGQFIGSNQGLILVNDIEAYKLDSTNKLILIYQNETTSNKIKILKNDKIGNVLIGYKASKNYTSDDYTTQAIAIVNNKVLDLTKSIITHDNKFLDIYADDLRHKIMTVGHQGIYIFSYLQDGSHVLANKSVLVKTFGRIISGIAGDEEGNVIFASEEKDIYKITQDWNYEQIFKANKELLSNGKLYFSRKNKKYYGYSNSFENYSYLREIDLINNKLVTLKVPIEINDLTIENDKLQICGHDVVEKKGKILSLDLNKFENKFTPIFKCERNINGVFKSSDKYWISTIKGLIVCDQNYKEIKRFDRFQNDKKLYLEYDIIRLVDTFNSKILAGTIGGGIYIIDPLKLEVIKNLNQKSGLSDNKAIGVLKDNLGYCWIPTWNGLNIIDRNFNVIKKFYQHNGLPNAELNTKSYFKDINGILYFGTLNGIFCVDPAKALEWKVTNGIHFKNATSISGDKTEISKNLDIKSNIDKLKIEFSSPDYYINKYEKHIVNIEGVNQQNILIEGLSASINNPENESSIIKANVLFSDYKQEIPLKISTDYYTYLKIFSIIAFFVLLTSLIVSRIKQRELEKTENNKKISLLELNALQNQMNPHFIFNALGAIQYFIQTHNSEKADEYLADFALLMRKILESSKSRFITLNDELKLLKLYMGLEQIRFENKFEYEIIEDDDLDLDFKIPPMILQPYIENAINHGLVNLSERPGLLTLEIIYLDEKNITIKIKDNGVGREKAASLSNKLHKSMSMQIVNDRIETFNSIDNSYVSSTINDLYDEHGKPRGTEIILSFKENNFYNKSKNQT